MALRKILLPVKTPTNEIKYAHLANVDKELLNDFLRITDTITKEIPDWIYKWCEEDGIQDYRKRTLQSLKQLIVLHEAIVVQGRSSNISCKDAGVIFRGWLEAHMLKELRKR